jgi:hypothetical protein
MVASSALPMSIASAPQVGLEGLPLAAHGGLGHLQVGQGLGFPGASGGLGAPPFYSF